MWLVVIVGHDWPGGKKQKGQKGSVKREETPNNMPPLSIIFMLFFAGSGGAKFFPRVSLTCAHDIINKDCRLYVPVQCR
jgi:hypothetical protein